MIPSHLQLLRLCSLVYDMAPGATALPAGPADTNLGGTWVTVSNAIEDRSSRDFAVVGMVDECLIVGIRGTQPPVASSDLGKDFSILRDWLNDLVVFDPLSPVAKAFPGVVHAGFAEAARGLWFDSAPRDGIRTHLLRLVSTTAPKRIIVTGHSKGGPVANLVGWLIRQEAALRNLPLEIVTFAAARAGNPAFAATIDRTVACFRYETYDDIVPFVPPGPDFAPVLRDALVLAGVNLGATADFVPLGKPFREAAGARWFTRLPFGIGKWLQGYDLPDVAKAVAAHSIAVGSGYDQLVKASSDQAQAARVAVFGN